MPIRLKFIEAENFKSYKGHKIIGPLKPFNAVVGPNGSGKSNFMDAISFVMGEKTQNLRVKKLSDLIHGAAIGKPISKSASVTAIFSLESEDDKEISFKRSIQGSTSDYEINGNVVSRKEYMMELEKIKINVKAKNFLVFQGAVESVAMKNPKEITSLFEEICGSGDLKEEYDQLKRHMMKLQEEMKAVNQRKKAFTSERKGAKLEKEEADKYADLMNDLNEKQVEHQLYRLYYNEVETKKLEEDLTKERQNFDGIQKNKEEAERILKEKKKENGILNKNLARLEQDIREVEVEVAKKRPQFIESKERVSHIQRKLDGAVKTLKQAQKAHETQKNNIDKLEKELAEVERSQREYEVQIAEQSQSQGRDIHLEEAQVREYYRLKKEVVKKTARYMQELEMIAREQRCDQDTLDRLFTMKTEYENRHRQKLLEKEEISKRMGRLAEHISSSQHALHELKQTCEEMQLEVNSSKGRVENIQKQLDDVRDQLGDAHMEKQEVQRKKKKQEIIENFKSKHAGVYDRMINICQPIHNRYNIPVTKVMGKFMEAIIVDTEHTARQCITYLKEQMLEPETFLPLDYIQPVKLKENLRNLKEPRGIKLLYDVLKFPQEISKAVLFVTKNTLICETPEDANKVAYELGTYHDAVALDGTFYRKSGIISGGTLDLARKAKRWDDKFVDHLKQKKEELLKEYGEARKTTRKESEIGSFNSKIESLELILRYSRTDMENTKMQLRTVEKEVSHLMEQIQLLGPKIESTQTTMQFRKNQIDELESKVNNVEDVIFSKFCQEIKIKNIRQYEDKELRTQEERKEKRLDFQKQINKITSNLEFEMSKDTQENITRWEKIVTEEQKTLKDGKKQEQKYKDEIDKDLQRIDELKTQGLGVKEEISKMEKEIEKARKQLKSISINVQTAQKSLVSLEGKVDKKKSERHVILLQCKVDNIIIPLLEGNMDYIVVADPRSQTSSEDSRTPLENEARIKIDYDVLPENLKKLKDKDEIKKHEDELLDSIKSLRDTLDEIKAPNFRALEKLQNAHSKLQSTNEEFLNLQKTNKNAINAFEKIKQQRYDKLMKCLDHVSNKLDRIYKSLTQNESAQALLIAENPEEPYLEGINYNCVAPGKRFQPMSNLSGGEKTLAALALLLAIHSYQPSPFFVLDEIDAALDNTNINKVAAYINENTQSLQTIVISLKDEFFVHADNLIGIYADPADDCLVSQVLSMNLTEYD